MPSSTKQMPPAIIVDPTLPLPHRHAVTGDGWLDRFRRTFSEAGESEGTSSTSLRVLVDSPSARQTPRPGSPSTTQDPSLPLLQVPSVISGSARGFSSLTASPNLEATSFHQRSSRDGLLLDLIGLAHEPLLASPAGPARCYQGPCRSGSIEPASAAVSGSTSQERDQLGEELEALAASHHHSYHYDYEGALGRPLDDAPALPADVSNPTSPRSLRSLSALSLQDYQHYQHYQHHKHHQQKQRKPLEGDDVVAAYEPVGVEAASLRTLTFHPNKRPPMRRHSEASQAEDDTDMLEPRRPIDDCAAGMSVEPGFGNQLPGSY